MEFDANDIWDYRQLKPEDEVIDLAWSPLISSSDLLNKLDDFAIDGSVAKQYLDSYRITHGLSSNSPQQQKCKDISEITHHLSFSFERMRWARRPSVALAIPFSSSRSYYRTSTFSNRRTFSSTPFHDIPVGVFPQEITKFG